MPSCNLSARIATTPVRHVQAQVTTSAFRAMEMHHLSKLQKLKVTAIQKPFFQHWKQADGSTGCL
jgi:hypothetical protein